MTDQFVSSEWWMIGDEGGKDEKENPKGAGGKIQFSFIHLLSFPLSLIEVWQSTLDLCSRSGAHPA
jgi:hypothetical protein